jgi:hypothetical protein
MQLCGPQVIEQLRFEKQQLKTQKKTLVGSVMQHKGRLAVLLTQLAQQQSSSCSCSSINVLAQAVAQQTLQGATLCKALQLKHQGNQQREVSAVPAGLWAAGTAAALFGPVC